MTPSAAPAPPEPPLPSAGAPSPAPRSTELERQFELTARAAGIGYWSTDAATRTPRWNEQAFRLHGLPPHAQALSMAEWLERFVHADDRSALRMHFDAWVASRQPLLEQEFRIVRADGVVRRLLSHSRLEPTPAGIDFYGVLQDVTAQRAAETALREAGERVALATRAAGIAIWEQDLVSGVAYWDEQMWRLRGLQPQPVAPSMPDRLALVHPDDREPMLAESARAAEEGRLSVVEFRVQWPDGQWRWLASRATVLRDASGKPLRRVGVNWDITDARSAQRAREQSVIALRESQAKSQFLSRMSHELRTPLNAVLGFTQLLLAGGERLPAETRRRHLEQVEIAGKHLLSLIDDVLDLSSLEGGELRIEPQSVPLDALVEQTLPLVSALAERHGVRIHAGALGSRVHADPTRLRQVLLNLLTNAIKYNRAGGEVSIDSERRDDAVALVVADTGRGMDAAQLRQAFEPFNRLGREHEGIEGTGIGLPIVRALVERMGGRLEIASTPGRGSRFAVCLPAERKPPPATATAAAPAPPPGIAAPARSRHEPPEAAAPARLLYLEDNPIHLMVVQELAARRPNLTFEAAASVAEGLHLALRRPPDLILVAMQLPDGDGHAVLHRLRASPATASIPCIALSAQAAPDEAARALRAGFADHWIKPIDFARFDRTLDALFGAPRNAG
jgi:hypothetical protein